LKETFSQMEVSWPVQILPEFSNEGHIRIRTIYYTVKRHFTPAGIHWKIDCQRSPL